jgi:hypothetical protein
MKTQHPLWTGKGEKPSRLKNKRKATDQLGSLFFVGKVDARFILSTSSI